MLLLLLLLRVCALYALRQPCKDCQSTPPGCVCSACVGSAVRCACVAPERRARLLFSLTARVCGKKKLTEHPRQHAAVVDKTHGGVIDVASAPGPLSAA